MNKILTIAVTACKESVRQPAFYLLVAVSGALLLLFPFIPYFTFGEDVKMVKDTGLATITVCGLLLALFSASTCIADELEGRTAITLLSKPITRRQFIVGKFIGILAAVLIAFIILSVIFSASIYYKVGYDAKESSGQEATAEARWEEVAHIQPGVALAFCQVAVLTSISVAISTRLPMLVNLVICLAVFMLGHLSPLIVRQAGQGGGFELLVFMAKLFALVLPALENFNVASAVAAGPAQALPWFPCVFWPFIYCMLYCAAAVMLALVLFEDRDLA